MKALVSILMCITEDCYITQFIHLIQSIIIGLNTLLLSYAHTANTHTHNNNNTAYSMNNNTNNMHNININTHNTTNNNAYTVDDKLIINYLEYFIELLEECPLLFTIHILTIFDFFMNWVEYTPTTNSTTSDSSTMNKGQNYDLSESRNWWLSEEEDSSRGIYHLLIEVIVTICTSYPIQVKKIKHTNTANASGVYAYIPYRVISHSMALMVSGTVDDPLWDKKDTVCMTCICVIYTLRISYSM